MIATINKIKKCRYQAKQSRNGCDGHARFSTKLKLKGHVTHLVLNR